MTDQYSDHVPIKWSDATFVWPEAGGLAVDIEGVSCTLVAKGDDYLLAFSLKVSNATLPDAETMVKAIAAGIHTLMDEGFEATWTAENDPE